MVNFKPIVFAEGELVYTDGGILAEYAWLLVVLPFVAALVITFTGKYLPTVQFLFILTVHSLH